MRFGYGLITCQRPPDDPRSDAEIYRDAIERCVVAERAGFDSAWVSEHHFVDDGYMPSLPVLAAAIAQATQTIEIGTAVLLAPLYHPLRLAEDAATVDLISGGRFILGIGAGWRPEEFDVLEVPQSERTARMRETVKVLRGAWSEGAFDYKGMPVNVTPKPAHAIPIWMGGFAPGAVKRAGRIGDGFLGSSSGGGGVETFAQQQSLALEGRRASGRDEKSFAFALHVPVYCSESGDPWEEVKPYYTYLRWKYGDMAGARGSTNVKSPPPFGRGPAPGAAEAGRPRGLPDEEQQLRSTIICGTPDEVAKEIGAFGERLGNDIHFICRSDFPGMPQKQSLDLIELLAAKVFPALR
jgi:alkanesulfonate monooxygenase SsuD/methylene tetrahydromethanopterin reductase-like flavin-dependent oxidoreductase (luciferase family)